MILFGKRIVLGVCGSVAAYKAAFLVRALRTRGAEVRVVMTHSARKFVTPLSFQSLSGHPVATEAFDGSGDDGMTHINLARWADMILIAPASAHIVAKLAAGLSDDLLSMVCVASDKPLVIAPAMNQQMWKHPSTRANIATLCQRDVAILGPGDGEQACGDVGEGRMLEPDDIADAMEDLLGKGRLAGHKVVITAGPTLEAIDPVRYIGNRSSGKMGFALANSALSLGAQVVLIAGPVALETPRGVMRVDVVTADEMCTAALNASHNADIFIGCAAVSDYRPTHLSTEKMKRDQQERQVTLTQNVDIVKAVGEQNPHLYMVGFAAETDNLEANAKAKLLEKRLDIIFANKIDAQSAVGVDSDYNQLTAYWRSGKRVFDRALKSALGHRVLALIADHYLAHNKAADNEQKDTA